MREFERRRPDDDQDWIWYSDLNTPPDGQRATTALPQFAGQIVEQPVYAVLLDASQG